MSRMIYFIFLLNIGEPPSKSIVKFLMIDSVKVPWGKGEKEFTKLKKKLKL